jgi:hypothetical protein
MGLTPLDGLPGGTRSGSVDPVLVFHHTPAASEAVDFKGTRLSRGEMLLNKYVRQYIMPLRIIVTHSRRYQRGWVRCFDWDIRLSHNYDSRMAE